MSRQSAIQPSSHPAILAVLLAACTPGASDDRGSADAEILRPVRVAPISDTVAAPVVTASGTVGARDELELSFKVGGVIASVEGFISRATLKSHHCTRPVGSMLA